MSVANDLIHDLCISPDHPKVSRTDSHLLIIGIPVQRDGRILPALQNGIRNRLNVLPRLSGQIYAFQCDPILNNVSCRLYRTGNRSALRRRHRHDKERYHHGKCQNDCDHAARWHREFHQELYKSGGMISFLSFVFFCKLKKDKINHQDMKIIILMLKTVYQKYQIFSMNLQR